MDFPWDIGEKPVLINDEGYEWYLDRDFTKYAREEDIHGNSGLKYVVCYFIKKGEYINRAIVDNEINVILYSSQLLESIAAHIDFMKMAEGKAIGQTK